VMMRMTRLFLTTLFLFSLYFVVVCATRGDRHARKIEPKDPDDHRNFTEIITSKGYPCETHHVTTEDGYILTLFRMPYGRYNGNSTRPRIPIHLQHGLLDSSFTWIVNMPNESLSYILADAGFDVWMGNNRGNTYSKKHVTLKPDQKEFWQFSWDQMARYDFPAFVTYIKNVTGFSQIGYVGHSEGTLQVFAGLSQNPSFADNLFSFVAFGPIATVGHITNFFLRALADFDVDELFVLLGDKQFLPSTKVMNDVFPIVCRDDPGICDDVIEFICGKHKGAFNNSRMQVVAAHEPGGTSVQNIVHFSQGVRKDTFQMYDYGSDLENRRHYNQSKPPMYDLGAFPSARLPTSLFYGTADELADPDDVAWLIGHLSHPPVYAIELDHYAHLDYVWDYTAVTTFYPKVLELLVNASSVLFENYILP